MAMIPRQPPRPSIEKRRRETIARYPGLWKRMIGEWRAADGRDSAWLLYSANYLLRTGSARWAIDPLTLRWRVPEAGAVSTRRDLADLSFVVLTHRHADHLDFDLIRSLRDLPILWIVPDWMRESVLSEGGLAKGKVLAVSPRQPIEIDGIRLISFAGLHYEGLDGRRSAGAPASPRGVPSSGCLVEFGQKRWLFPGDTRDYRADLLPSFGPVSGLFAHVWLGRGKALDESPPLLDALCGFCVDLQPQRIVLTHLEEFGRPATEVWKLEHADRLRTRLRSMNQELTVEVARTGDRVFL